MSNSVSQIRTLNTKFPIQSLPQPKYLLKLRVFVLAVSEQPVGSSVYKKCPKRILYLATLKWLRQRFDWVI
jgi:hypothetical protein